MKKIGTITFHSSYNFGSNLQAYALQEYIKNLGNFEYNIINLRVSKQKEMYRNVYELNGFKNRLKQLFLIRYKKDFFIQKNKFEDFFKKNLNLTKEYSNLDELNSENFNYDYYISGSDQIWNLNTYDFSWAYYLEFVKKGKRISYSTSFGPTLNKAIDEQKRRIREDLLKYDCISVREKGSYDFVESLTNNKPEILVDPTMLLSKEKWLELFSERKKINKKYILLYDLKGNYETVLLAKRISKRLGLPILITKYMDIKTHLDNKIIKKYDCGPIDFIYYIYNAELILSTSFHGNVFSILFNKPFYSINGDKDFRIKNLLEKMCFQDRNINYESNLNIVDDYKKIAFDKSNTFITKEIKKSEKYLKTALEMGD